jgi:hypothetical protein
VNSFRKVRAISPTGRPAWLANAHAKLDAAAAAAYGFAVDPSTSLRTSLTDEQILEKLLALNLEQAAAEKKSSVAPKKRASRAKTQEELI